MKIQKLSETEHKELLKITKQCLQINKIHVFSDILLCYILIIISILLLSFESSATSYFLQEIFGAVLLAASLSRLFLFEHEASHYNLHENKKTNDFISNLILAPWFGRPITSFREGHSTHHKHFFTEKDKEHSYTQYPGLKFFLIYLLGFGVLKTQTQKQNNCNYYKFISLFLYIFIGSFIYYNSGFISVFLFSFSIFGLFPTIATTRQILEHRPIDGKNLRNFKSSFLGFWLGAAGFKYHLYHHLFPAIPYYNLKYIDNYFKNNISTINIKEYYISYTEAFERILDGTNSLLKL